MDGVYSERIVDWDSRVGISPWLAHVCLSQLQHGLKGKKVVKEIGKLSRGIVEGSKILDPLPDRKQSLIYRDDAGRDGEGIHGHNRVNKLTRNSIRCCKLEKDTTKLRCLILGIKCE